jgi:hypothetical protein
MIVIVAPEDDPHARAVAEALKRTGTADTFWLDLEKAQENYILEWHAHDAGMEWSVASRTHSTTLDPHAITAVYWRRVVSALTSPLLALPTSANLDQYEVFWSLRWLLEALPPQLFPLGHPQALARAENKHRQFLAAIECGLRVPASFHSNSLEALRRFIAGQREIALKALRLPGVIQSGAQTETRHIFCKSFAPEFLLERLQGMEQTQLFCQESIRRARDLRIMVFPGETIAAEIGTASLPEGKLDWREDCLALPHRIVPVSPAFDRQLRRFLERMELKAGYFDFAVPDEGPPVFFECNTNAQWIWIEQLTGHPVSEAIARALMAGTA